MFERCYGVLQIGVEKHTSRTSVNASWSTLHLKLFSYRDAIRSKVVIKTMKLIHLKKMPAAITSPVSRNKL